MFSFSFVFFLNVQKQITYFGVFSFPVEDIQGRDNFEDEPREEGQGFYVRRRSKRSVSLIKHIELLLVADYSMTQYYSSRDLESYLFTVMNMVSQAGIKIACPCTHFVSL